MTSSVFTLNLQQSNEMDLTGQDDPQRGNDERRIGQEKKLANEIKHWKTRLKILAG